METKHKKLEPDITYYFRWLCLSSSLAFVVLAVLGYYFPNYILVILALSLVPSIVCINHYMSRHNKISEVKLDWNIVLKVCVRPSKCL